MNIELSIIIPTYKRPGKLGRALSSIAGAYAGAHEIIVIDDCPEGSAAAIALQFGARYLCKAGSDRGLSASRNLGMHIARGRWLCFLDDDDFFVENGLEHLLAGADRSAGLVFGDHGMFNEREQAEFDLSTLTIDALLVCNRIPVGSYLIDRAMIRNDFDTRMRSHEDWDFLLSHIRQAGLQHVPGKVVMIDKCENASTSMQARRRSKFWLDFVSIYARFPAPHLAESRAAMLQTLGIQIPPALLEFDDTI